MKEFFRGQLDYIYFFYGLSFIVMALICLSIGREKLRRFPWLLLGLFALLHGFCEWIDLYLLINGADRTASFAHLALLCGSFLCLSEFARIGYGTIRGTPLKRWAYVPLLALLPLGHRYGLNGWLATTRYFLGFPAAYAAARAILAFSGREKESRPPLTILSAALALYAVAAGLIVPACGFLAAPLVNVDTFYDTLGVPVQLIRALLSFCAALSIWFYSSTLTETAGTPQLFSVKFLPTKWTIALTLILFIAGGWLFTNYLDYYAGIKTIQRNEALAGSQLDALTKELSRLGKSVLSLSRTTALRGVVSSSPSPRIRERAAATLEQFRARTDALECALLDRRGMPILSTANGGGKFAPPATPAATPYFKDALTGKTGYYFKLGSVYNERTYYVSHPVKDPAGTIAGVAVIAKKIPAEPLFQYRLFSMLMTLLVCIIAIVFLIVLRRREALIRFIERVHARLAEVDRLKTDFVSVVSHELRTPLTSIKNAAGILMKGGPLKRSWDERERELLTIIRDNVERQTRMVDDLLDVSRIEAGVMPVETQPTDSAALIRDTVSSLRLLAEEKKTHLQLQMQDSGRKVLADPDHLRRIINNLVVNAIKFTPAQGNVTVRSATEGAEMKITVADTGIGIAADELSTIFGKFYRAKDASARAKRGWGLGLAIAKGLVEAQKGRIWVESRPGEGSSFSFTLPLAEAEEETDAEDTRR